MMPRTINGLGVFDVMSAMQKHIRRNEERQAMHCACEMGHSSKAFFTMLCNRLEVISHEDVGLANPAAIVFVATAVEQARRHYNADKHGTWRMMLGNAIRMLCRSDKSREGDHFQAAVGLHAYLYGVNPEIPDYAYDMHTRKGASMGRDLEHFIKEATKLVPPAKPDKYAKEAHAAWKEKRTRAGKGKKAPAGEDSQLF